MRETYLVYPEARKRLQDSGLIERINREARKSNYPSFLGMYRLDDLRWEIGNLRERKYFEPKNPKYVEFAKRSNPLLKNPDKYKWQLGKMGLNATENVEIDDFRLLTGYLASIILTPKEFWIPEKFGFPSVFDMFGSIGAFMARKSNERSDEHYSGHRWVSHPIDGAQFITEVTGSNHGDLRIFRTDETPYPTTDPLGNKVSYRPKLSMDSQFVSGYHSTEPHLLASVLKFLEQQELNRDFFEQGGKKILEKISNLRQHVGNFADFGDGSIGGARMAFAHYGIPIPTLDKNNQTSKWTFDRVCTTEQGTYGLYISHSGDLVFSYENGPQNPKKGLNMVLPRNEVYNLIEGLFIQSSKGRGRTSMQQLSDVLNFRFSEQFKLDREIK